MQRHLELLADAAAPARARALAGELAGTVPDAVVRDLQLLISELVTNSVRHSEGCTVRIALEAEAPDLVRAEVVDDGDGVIEIRQASDDEDLRTEGGHGLRLVEAVAQRWGVHEGSTHVWFELGAS